MRTPAWLAIPLILSAGLPAAQIEYTNTPLGGNSYRYTYSITGVTFTQYEGLDIRFDPTLFGTLSSPAAGSGFSTLVLQPNNPPGTFGDYYAIAQVSNPSLAVSFQVSVTYLGAGTPGSQPFFVDQFDSNGNLISIASSGVTSQPEPSTLASGALGLIACTILVIRRRSRIRRAETWRWVG
jgi:hypothetical protein